MDVAEITSMRNRVPHHSSSMTGAEMSDVVQLGA